MTRTTKAAQAEALANRTNVLDALAGAVWNGITARDALIDAYKAAAIMSDDGKTEDEDTRNTVLWTYMARRLYPAAPAITKEMAAEGQRVLALPGVNAKVAEKRTVEQEKFANGARQYIFGIRAAAGVNAKDTRGGANNTTPAAAKENPVATIPTSQAGTPSEREDAKYETGADVRHHLFQASRTLMMFVEKHHAITDPKARDAVARFAKAAAGWEKPKDA